FLTVRGPETRATIARCPPEGEWVAIRFRPGVYLSRLPPSALSDRRDVTLPGGATRSFWLNGSTWEFPTFENADTFIARLARRGILVMDRPVQAVLRNEPRTASLRSAQRHFLHATGITQATFRTIERARHA